MSHLTIDQLSIPFAWLAFFIAILYSDFRNKNSDDPTKKVIDQLLWIYLLIWKFSYVPFSWDAFLEAPMSVLYFDGGFKGHILALIILLFVLVKNRTVLNWSMMWQYWARFIAVYHVLYYGLGGQWGLSVLWLVLFLLTEWKYGTWILLANWLLLLWLGGWLDGFVHMHAIVLLSFILKTKTYQQFALLGVISLIAMTLTDVQLTNSSTSRAEIDLMTTTGERYTLSEQEQSLTVVNFFATWCPPCKDEMPHLQSFAENLPENVALIGVNLTSRDEGQQALQNFIDTYKVSYPVLLDETDYIGQSFHVLSIPTTVILNRDGEELDRIVGPISEHALRNLVKQYQ